MSDLYREAIDVINTHGWTQHTFGDESRGFCATGALRNAAGIWPKDNAFQRLSDTERTAVYHEVWRAEIALADAIQPDWRSEYYRLEEEGIGEVADCAFSVITQWNDEPDRTEDDVIQLLREVSENSEVSKTT